MKEWKVSNIATNSKHFNLAKDCGAIFLGKKFKFEIIGTDIDC